MKTILFAWDLGVGLGHIGNLRRVALRLRAPGRRLVAVLRERSALRLLGDIFDETIPAPRWPGPKAPVSSATLHDTLASAGLADFDVMKNLFTAWEAVFNATQPSLVIGDFAVSASLSARGRIPVMLVGNGYCLPPAEMAQFPLLHAYAPPAWNEQSTLDTLNKALRHSGRASLTRLPEIFSADARVVLTFPMLDPYHVHRVCSVDGPALDRIPPQRSRVSDRIVAYLSPGYPVQDEIVAALLPFAPRLWIYAPALTDRHREALSAAGANLQSAAGSLVDTLADAALFIHRGGGSASEALVVGAPQLLLSTQIEQDLTGLALEAAGIGRHVRTYLDEIDLHAYDIEMMAHDAALQTRAAELAQFHRSFLETNDALARCEQACRALLGD